MERTSGRKRKENIEDTDDKDTDMECGAVWFRNMEKEDIKNLRPLKCGLGESELDRI